MTSLYSALERLDGLLAQAVALAEAAYGSGTRTDPFRGLYLELDEVERLLARPPGVPLLSLDPPSAATAEWFDRLAGEVDLTAFDLDVVLVALAPELDLRYERIFAYLHDDVTQRRPTVDLMLNLFCSTAEERLEQRHRFEYEAPLVSERIIQLIPPSDQHMAPMLSHIVKLDDQVAGAIVGNRGIDPRITSFCELVSPNASLDELLVPPNALDMLIRFAEWCTSQSKPVRAYFRGPQGTGRGRAAEAVAAKSGIEFLTADVGRAPTGVAFTEACDVLVREARLRDALLFVSGLEALEGSRNSDREHVDRVVARHDGPVIFAGSAPWSALASTRGNKLFGVVEVIFEVGPVELRRVAWERALLGRGIEIGGDALEALSARFRLTLDQIEAAAQLAASTALVTEDRAGDVSADVFAAARAQTGHELGELAVKAAALYSWDDIVLPDDVLSQLREIPTWVVHRDRVLNQWGFARKLSYGKGVAALFTGPSGTGKTMAAEIIGRDLGLDVYAIDLSKIVSKWIGETEKNLDGLFRVAGNAILCFNEADALFGKRSEISDAHDRYANIETSYLLQKIEAHDGLTILTTNLLQNIDDAFIRRLAFSVHFPFPEVAERRRIWARVWPREAPLGDDLDVDHLASTYRLSGGNIKNAALAAAFAAASAGSQVCMRHVLHGVRREFAKMGRALSEEDLRLGSTSSDCEPDDGGSR